MLPHRKLLVAVLMISTGVVASPNGGMRLLAKGPAQLHVTVFLPGGGDELRKHGANQDDVKTQVELAFRRCGFSILEGPGFPGVFVNLRGLDHGSLGFSGTALVSLMLLRPVEGEDVFVDAWTDYSTFSGAANAAAKQIREVLAPMLDEICNEYMGAVDQVGTKHRNR
jgi:hypothetical protein